MKFRMWAAAIAALQLLPAAAQVLTRPLAALADSQLTQSCNTLDATSVIVDASAQARADIVAAVSGANDADLLTRLWRPASARQTNYVTMENEVVLGYDAFQDVAQIRDAIAADPVLAARGVRAAFSDGYACFSVMPPPPVATVTEYYHPSINHYVLSTDADDGAALVAEGWQATGESFRALRAGAGVPTCYGGVTVFRFRLSPGWRGSRFLTADPAECGSLRRLDPGWRPDGIAFVADRAVNGTCSKGAPIYRAYNGRAAWNDSNHRFTPSFATYQHMLEQGWTGEGIAFCAYSL